MPPAEAALAVEGLAALVEEGVTEAPAAELELLAVGVGGALRGRCVHAGLLGRARLARRAGAAGAAAAVGAALLAGALRDAGVGADVRGRAGVSGAGIGVVTLRGCQAVHAGEVRHLTHLAGPAGAAAGPAAAVAVPA